MTVSTKSRFGVALAAFTALATLSGLAQAADKIGNCEVTGKKGAYSITPAIPGQLTYETNLPAPGWNNGDTPETIKDGYEYCLAANVAWRLGLDKVVIKNVDFDALVAGQTKDFDIALSQISITDKRKEVVQFSVPYFDSDVGVLAKKGKKVASGDMKGLRIGVQQGTTGADFIADTVKPKTPAKVFPDTPAMFTALMANQIDVAITDTAIVVPQAATSGGYPGDVHRADGQSDRRRHHRHRDRGAAGGDLGWQAGGGRPVFDRREIRRAVPQGLGQCRGDRQGPGRTGGRGRHQEARGEVSLCGHVEDPLFQAVRRG
jgi:polar amino acid transport system substrate-binding protein